MFTYLCEQEITQNITQILHMLGIGQRTILILLSIIQAQWLQMHLKRITMHSHRSNSYMSSMLPEVMAPISSSDVSDKKHKKALVVIFQAYAYESSTGHLPFKNLYSSLT